MRFLGHPVHVILVHFPIALWPAHAVLHLCAARLPGGVASVAGFWLLASGTLLGWAAALCGVLDLLEFSRRADPRLKLALIHGGVNGGVLLAFTVFSALESAHYPAIEHGGGFLFAEALVLVGLGVGNYFGGAIVWRAARRG